jgi:TetR/AcrR family fatty acid metabolism transcriptional regulator
MNRHSVVGGREKTGDRGDAGAKRTRILDAAVRIFADKGFYNAKVSEIARVAGVADGTIYLYFKSKDDLLISLFEDRMERINANLRVALAEAGSPVDKLRRLLELQLALVESDPRLAEVLTVELRQSAKFLREYRQTKFGEFLKLVAQPIEEGQRDGSLRADLDPPVVARALFGALDELALAWLLGPSPTSGDRAARRRRQFDPTRVAGQLAELFLEGLRAAPNSHSHSHSNSTPQSTPHSRRRAP